MENKNTKNEEVELSVNDIVTPNQLVMKRFLRNKLALAGIFILLAILAFTLIGPFLSPYDEYQLFYSDINDVEVVYGTEEYYNAQNVKIMLRAQPSDAHPLGTDANGRDVLVRLMYGGRISMVVGIASTILILTMGIILGGLAGYYGRWVDNLVMRFVEVVLCIPTVPVMLIIASVAYALSIPQGQKIWLLIIAISCLSFTNVTRIVRGQILSLREQEFMQAAEAVGLKPARRIFNHLIPNVMPQLIVSTTVGIGSIILLESALSFLGVGVDFPYSSWGNMVGAVTEAAVLRNYPFLWIPAGLLILLTVLSFNFIGDGLRDEPHQ